MDGNIASVQELLNYIHEHKLEDCGRFDTHGDCIFYVDIDDELNKKRYISYDFGKNEITLYICEKDIDWFDYKDITKEEAFKLRGIN